MFFQAQSHSEPLADLEGYIDQAGLKLTEIHLSLFWGAEIKGVCHYEWHKEYVCRRVKNPTYQQAVWGMLI